MMQKYFLFSLMCASIGVAASIPQHKAQQPLLPAYASSQSQVKVMLAFKENGSKMERLVRIPLNTQIVSGERLPSRLSTIKIIMAFTAQDHSVALEQLDRIRCRITAEINIEEQNATATGEVPEGLPWFMLNDGSLKLEDTSSRWFLGGRAIKSLECR